MKELKKEFFDIQTKYVGMRHQLETIENMNREFTDLFDRYLLSEIQFRIVTDKINQTIHIEPMREIDRYAIRGIITS